MAKPKNPLLSLGAHGTIGDALTFQKRGQATIARKKPIPTDPYSLAQAYQRWDYQDYAYLWTLESEASKQSYRTRASRYHITGFSLWMKEHLRDLPDLAGRWHLDEKGGAIAYDSSKYKTNGVISGASPTAGLIDGAQYFTLNDYIEITAPQLNFTSEDFSLIMRARFDDISGSVTLLTRGDANNKGYHLFLGSTGRLDFYTFQLAATQFTLSAIGAITTAIWYTLGVSRAGASVKLYKDGIDITDTPGVHIDPATYAGTALTGIYINKINYPMNGKIDELVIYNRALSPTEHKRHSERRYPP